MTRGVSTRVLSIVAGIVMSAMLLQVPVVGAEEKRARSQPSSDQSFPKQSARALGPAALAPAVPGLLPPSVSERVAPSVALPDRMQPAHKIREAARETIREATGESTGEFTGESKREIGRDTRRKKGRVRPSPLLRVGTPARRARALGLSKLGLSGSGFADRGITASVVRPRIPDNTRVDRLFDKAQKGDPVAQYHVGRMYRTGVGVISDAAMAMSWFKRAAQNNLAAAHYHIGLMRMAGENGRPDIVEAFARFKMAAGGGDVRAAAFLFYIGVRMTAKELRQAQIRLAELRRVARAVAASAAAK